MAPPLIFAEATAQNPRPEDWQNRYRMREIKELLDMRERAREKLSELVALCGSDRGFDFETCQICNGTARFQGKPCYDCFETGRADMNVFDFRDAIWDIQEEIDNLTETA